MHRYTTMTISSSSCATPSKAVDCCCWSEPKRSGSRSRKRAAEAKRSTEHRESKLNVYSFCTTSERPVLYQGDTQSNAGMLRRIDGLFTPHAGRHARHLPDDAGASSFADSSNSNRPSYSKIRCLDNSADILLICLYVCFGGSFDRWVILVNAVCFWRNLFC